MGKKVVAMQQNQQEQFTIMLMALVKGDSNKMKGSISMPNMNPCTVVIAN